MVLQAPGLAVGFVVAGGKSRRMGHDKALLPWRGGTLLDHAVQRLHAVCGSVHILSGPQERYADRGLPVHRDQWDDAGPLAGVHAGLSALAEPHELALFLAVDLPLVPPALLGALCDAAVGHDAVVPFVGELPQPLCAAYRGTCRGPIEKSLAAGQRRVTSFWSDLSVRELREDDISRFGDLREIFLNVNEPHDLERALATGRAGGATGDL